MLTAENLWIAGFHMFQADWTSQKQILRSTNHSRQDYNNHDFEKVSWVLTKGSNIYQVKTPGFMQDLTIHSNLLLRPPVYREHLLIKTTCV